MIQNAKPARSAVKTTSVQPEATSYIKTTDIDKSNFVVLTSKEDNHSLWIGEAKFSDINSMLDDDSKIVEYPLKRTIKGDPDEGRQAKEGKAVKVQMSEEIVTISVYTQVYGESWSLNHDHVVERKLFEAYALVLKNNQEVIQAEKEAKKPKNFSMNLPS